MYSAQGSKSSILFHRWLPSVLFVLITWLTMLYWLQYGYDFTDEGRRQAISWFLFDHNEVVDSKFGSHFINAIWLHLQSAPSLWWSRVGFAMVNFLTCTLIFDTIRRRFHSWLAFLSSITAFSVLFYFTSSSIDYNNLPLLVVTAAFWLLEVTTPKNTNVQKLTYLIAGFLLGFSVLARFPYLPYMVVPLIVFFIKGFGKLSDTSAKRKLLFSSIGSALFFICLSVLLMMTGEWSHYLTHIQSTYINGFLGGDHSSGLAFHTHDQASIIAELNRQTSKLLGLTWPVFLGLFVLDYLKKHLHAFILSIIAIIGIYQLLPSIDLRYSVYYFLAVSIYYALRSLELAIKNPPKRGFVFWICLIMLWSFVGSNLGIRNMVLSGGCGLVLAFGMSRGAWNNQRFSLNHHVVLAIGVIALAFATKSQFIYRDKPLNQLNTPFKSTSLKGIYSNESAVKAIDEVLEFLLSKKQYSGDFLAINTIPSMYYLADLDWKDSMYWLKRDMTTLERKAYFDSENAPALILVNLKNSRSAQWPEIAENCIERDQEYFDFYMNYLPSSAYQLQFENAGFQVWEKAIK